MRAKGGQAHVATPHSSVEKMRRSMIRQRGVAVLAVIRTVSCTDDQINAILFLIMIAQQLLPLVSGIFRQIVTASGGRQNSKFCSLRQP